MGDEGITGWGETAFHGGQLTTQIAESQETLTCLYFLLVLVLLHVCDRSESHATDALLHPPPHPPPYGHERRTGPFFKLRGERGMHATPHLPTCAVLCAAVERRQRWRRATIIC